MRGKWRHRLPGPKLMMAEGTQKARGNEKRAVEINDSPILAPKETCHLTLEEMARLPSPGDSCCVSLTNRGHVEAKRESILCSGASTERPLVLSLNEGEPASRMSCIAPHNSSNRHLTAQAFSNAMERATKISLFRSRFASDHATNGSLTEKFAAWKDSASGAVESIRKRLGAFRRTRSLDVESEGKYCGNEASLTLNKLRSKCVTATTDTDQKLAEKAPLNESSDKITLPRGKDVTKSALSIEQKAQDGHCNSTNKNATTNCKSEQMVETHVCDTLDNGKFVCATCMLGTEKEKEFAAINSDPGSVTISRVEPKSKIYNGAQGEIVVQKQPVVRPLVNSDPNVDVEIASPPNHRSSADDLTSNGVGGAVAITGDTHPHSLMAMQQNAVGEQQEEDQVSMENKGVPRKCISGVNLWDLRNSLEHTTIELKYINFSQEERVLGSGQEKQNTRDMAESSPRSTPSSEFFISRDKSMTDSDEGGNDHNPIDAAIDSALLDRSAGSSGAQLKCNRPSVESQIVRENISSATTNLSGFSQQKGNVVITQAVIERSPDNRDVENRSSTRLAAASERRRNFGVSKQSSLFDSNDSDVFTSDRPLADEHVKVCHSASPRRSSLRVDRQTRTPSSESNASDKEGRKMYNIIRFVDDGQSIEIQNGSNTKSRRKNSSAAARGSPTFRTSASCSSSIQIKSGCEKEVAVAASPPPHCSPPKTTSMDSIVSSTSSSLSYTNPSSETTSLPPTARYRTSPRCKFQTKPGSSTSSATTSPSSPTGIWPHSSHMLRTHSASEMSESDSMDSYSHSSSRSSSSLRGLSRLFRRSSTQKQQNEQIPTFCGYTMGRDYCVDVETDRIFKEFLCQDSSSTPATPTSSEPLPPPSHMLPPRPLNRSNATQLRRQVMRKQYSDSIAMYYGQRMRRWRFAKQKSDSVNCPVDRGILRRQDKIEEEFDPEEINERLSSTSSRRDSDRPDFVPLTVNELMEWRRSSQDYTSSSSSTSRQISTHSNSLEEGTKMARRVTFRSSQSEC